MLSVAPSLAARVVRVAAVLVILTIVVASGVDKPDLIAFGIYLFAFVAVTGRSVPVSGRSIAIGACTGAGAAVLPTVAFVLWPPAPKSGGWALATVAMAAVVAGAVAAGRRIGPTVAGRWAGADAVVAGLLAAVVAAPLLPVSVTLLAHAGPEGWVPQMDSHALTPAARLAERRYLAADDYLPTLLVGDLLAVALGVLVLQMRTWGRRPTESASPARPIELDVTRPGTTASTDPSRTP